MEPVKELIDKDPSAEPAAGFKDKLANRWRRGRDAIQSLSGPQLLYFGAIAVLILSSDSSDADDSAVIVAGVMGILAMAMEFWPKFVALWDHLLGKGLLLVIYAIVANLALAASGQQINQVIGVEPSYLIYTLTLTTLFMAPLWLMAVSLLMMLLYVLVLNLTLMVAGLTRLLRVKVKPKADRETFPLLTIVARIVVVPIAVYTLGTGISIYGGSLNDFNFSWAGDDFEAAQIDPETLSDEEKARLFRMTVLEDREAAREELLKLAKQSDSAATPATDEAASEPSEPEEPDQTGEAEADEVRFLVRMIANLVYQFETYQHSHCNKYPGERIRFVGEEHVLVASRDASQPTGFNFAVRSCFEPLPERAAVSADANSDQGN